VCDPTHYFQWLSGSPSLPGTDFQTLPGGFSAQQLAYMEGYDDTGMAAAMSGATTGLTGWALNHPDQNGAIALVSDSEATSGPCQGTTADLAQTVAEAASGKAAIRTHVVSLGSVAALDAIAAAGGSVSAQSVTMQDLGATLSKLVEEVRACAYSIPVPANG